MQRIAILSVALTALLAAPATAQHPPAPGFEIEKRPTHFDISPPLRDIVPIRAEGGPNHIVPDFEPPEGTTNLYVDIPQPLAPTSPHVVQNWQGSGIMPAPNTNFEGIGEGISGYTVQVAPPDTQGDVGVNYYVQWVNTDFAIFDKNSGAIVYGPVAGSTLWRGFGGLCDTTNDGDPIVKYDQLADRWVMTQFALDETADQYAECIAVSQTGDPTGAWYRYSYAFSYLNDYPKLAVWPDSYYISYNMFQKFGSNYLYAGAVLCAYDRATMLTGAPATSLCTAPNGSYFSYLPSDLDGSTSPPAGADNYVMALGTDQLLLWTAHIDWATPSNSVFTGPTLLNVASFNDQCGGYPRGACIPQLGTSVKLESLGGRAMFRLPYRNFGSHESLVLSHSIDTGSEISGVRWYEIRDPGGLPTVYQSGTYAPDSHYRWMGSMAMDKEGNMAVGYSVSDSSMNPSIWYTGRLASDPLGQLPQSEAVIQNGTGSQTTWSQGDLERWGDYSSMSIDPVDDCTFWYTQEYLTEDGAFNWHTRIASFEYPSCSCEASPPAGLLASPSLDNSIDLHWDMVTGATEYRIYRSTTSGSGYTQVATVTAPTIDYIDTDLQGGVTYYYVVTNYDGSQECESAYSSESSATPTGPCDLAPTFSGISSATSSGGCAVDLSWSPATAICGGPVDYSVYRSTTPGFTPSLANRLVAGLSGTSYADASGFSAGATYYYIVRASDRSNGQEDTNTVEDSVVPLGALVPTTLYGPEDFESYADGNMAGWATGYFSGNARDWRGVRSCSGHSGAKVFRFGGANCSSFYKEGNHSFAYPPPIAVPAGSENTRLRFWHRWSFAGNDPSGTGEDGAYLRVSFDGGTWTYVSGASILSGSYNSGTGPWWSGNQTLIETIVDLDAACNAITSTSDGCAGNTVYIGFVTYTIKGSNPTTNQGWFIDDVEVTTDAPGPCGSTPSNVAYLTARSTSEQVKLEWVNPSGAYGSTRICRDTAGYPTDPTTCATVVVDKVGSAGAYDTYTDTTAANGTKYYYTAFVNNGSGVFSGAVNAWAYPFATTGKVKWAYGSAASSLAPTGVRPGAIGAGGTWAVSNDRLLHGMNPTAAGGDWPRTAPYSWIPMAMNGPAQARPPVVPTTAVPGASEVIFLGSEDGHAYAANAQTGTTLWQSPALGNILFASPSGMFTDFGGSWNLLFIGSRDATADNVMYALDPADGSVKYQFDNLGGANGIGIISSGATVDYANNRIYFASRARAGGSVDTLWCLSFDDTSFTKEWSAQLGDIDGAPTLFQGRLYVGNNIGGVSAVDPDTGIAVWTFAASGDGAVKGYVAPQAVPTVPRRLYFSTTTRLWSINDEGDTASSGWSVTTVPGPSSPLAPFGADVLYAGSSEGRLYQLDAATGAVQTSVVLGDGTATIGSPALDVKNSMAYVGSESGAVYGVELPLQEGGP